MDEEEGESSKSVKPPLHSQRGKSAATSSRQSVGKMTIVFQFAKTSCQQVYYLFFLFCFVWHCFSVLFRVQDSESSSDSDSDSDSEVIGPPVPPQHPAPEEEEDDDELVGPPLPPGYMGSTAHSDDDEQEEDNDDDDDDV